jgi:hypothetical protein
VSVGLGAGAGVLVAGVAARVAIAAAVLALAAGAGLVAAGLAWVPVVGYLEALALPAVAARLRRRAPERYAGLRTLAK